MGEQLLPERAGLYSLLHALYTYPLTEAVLVAVSGLAVAPNSPLYAGLRQMQTSLRANGQPAATVDRLNIEMTGLLEGPGLTPAPPYASYYLHNGQLMGPAAAAVRQVYLNWRLVPEGAARLPDDHLALELGFVAHLARLAANGEVETAAALTASRDFLRRHLWPWLPQFCAALASAGNKPFFVGLAHFTQATVQADMDRLNTVLDEIVSASPLKSKRSVNNE